ncbi:MAG: glycosyltransferase family 2 protein [Planctomycetes bacterium]|nr:glycosyltransferase family 2 protein [Planctomycetota bacterium]
MPIRTLTALPVFNEAQHLEPVLREVRRYSDDILVIDDGSSDGTPELLATQTDLQILTHEENQGYGAALRSAFLFAVEQDYDVLVTIDCDGQHEPRLIPELAAAVFPDGEEPIDIVSGSRYLRSFDGDSIPPEERRRINMDITRLVNERLGLSLTDTFCGFKAYRVASLPQLEISELGYAMPLQLWVQAVNAGMRIVEFPVPLVYLEEERSFGGSLDDGVLRIAHYRNVLEREISRTAVASGSASSVDHNDTS